MPISTPAPVPSWANITGKPTTISGFGITDSIVNSLTAGSGLLTSSSTGAINVSQNLTVANIGTFIIAFINIASISRDASFAGSQLCGFDTNGSIVSFGLSGTWRASCTISGGYNSTGNLNVLFSGYGNTNLFQRIA
jgi:hypothetical protein